MPDAPAAPLPAMTADAFSKATLEAFEKAAEFQPASATTPPPPHETPKPSQQQWAEAGKEAQPPAPATAAGKETKGEVSPGVAPAVLPDFKQAKEATPAPAEDETKGMTPSTASQWKAMKAKHHQEMETLQSKIKASQSQAVDPDEVANLKKANEDLLQRMKQFAVEKDPRFEAYFKGKMEGAIALAKSAGGEQGEVIAKLLMQPESDYRTNALNDAISALPIISQTRIGAVLNDIEKIHQERQSELSRSSENFSKIQQQQQQSQQQAQAEITKTFESVLQTARQHLPAFQTREGDIEWNKAVASREALVNHIVTGKMSPQELARAATWAATAPSLLQDLKARDAEIENLRTQMKALESSKPNAGAASTPSKTPDPNDKLDFGERIAAMAFGR